MQYKGMTFTRNATIEAYESKTSTPYCLFRYRSSRREIFIKSWSTTNMAYAEDGRVLLALDGSVWTSGTVRRA